MSRAGFTAELYSRVIMLLVCYRLLSSNIAQYDMLDANFKINQE